MLIRTNARSAPVVRGPEHEIVAKQATGQPQWRRLLRCGRHDPGGLELAKQDGMRLTELRKACQAAVLIVLISIWMPRNRRRIQPGRTCSSAKAIRLKKWSNGCVLLQSRGKDDGYRFWTGLWSNCRYAVGSLTTEDTHS